ncbi:hypothetical protein DVA67_031820 [Solirubrobacter sp. CPCC 204708]|uniref:Uncharacterized protein n=1 Tax=Solirubrobacter deserti TaxID=2282478 RepID=A0ABT4RQL6_9ACTN|nr:hypothetical protein [Solirubrobacter deserti]MBE2320591.1 hypothetical protein [Solirubrobacter deserti]MDA0140780.1 hypothetical protein [Solirubrobacter deserti]
MKPAERQPQPREPDPAVPAPGRAPGLPVRGALTPAAVLALQRNAGNHAVSQLLGRRPLLLREVSEEETVAQPTPDELATCRRCAAILDGLTQQARAELINGEVRDWVGDKFNTFMKFIAAGKDNLAVLWAANAIEERVYALLKTTKLPCDWKPQRAESMGSASKPDIVLLFADSKVGLIDVTSDAGHILRKAGNWVGGAKHIYAAEVLFAKIDLPHLSVIKQALGKTGRISIRIRVKKAGAIQKERKQQRDKDAARARRLWNTYGSVEKIAASESEFANAGEVRKFLRSVNFTAKGFKGKTRKALGGMDRIAQDEAKRKRARKARERRREIEAARANAPSGSDGSESESESESDG